MTSFTALTDRGRPGGNPYESILSTARGIGFAIPEPSRTCEDVQRASLLENIEQLLDANGQFPVLQATLNALQMDDSFYGFLDKDRLQVYTQHLQSAIEVLKEFTRERTSIIEKLMGEVHQNGIPVELEFQTEFKSLMNLIAQDKYKLIGLISQLRQVESRKESSVAWRATLEELRHGQKNLEASNRLLRKVTNDLKQYLTTLSTKI